MPYYKKKCVSCGKEFIAGTRNRILCKSNCRHYTLVHTDNYKYPIRISTSGRGAAHELIVAYDLMSRGFHVFRNFSPSGPCDLVIIGKNGKLLTIEVTTCYKGVTGENFPMAKKNTIAHIVAGVFTDFIIYFDTRTKKSIEIGINV